LGQGICNAACMVGLDVSNNPLTDAGAAALLLPLQPSGPSSSPKPKLAVLKLRACGLGLRACVALAAVLRAPGGPLAGAVVDLSLNDGIGNGIAKLEAACADESIVQRLGALRLAGCSIPDERWTALQKAATTPGAECRWMGRLLIDNAAQLLRMPPTQARANYSNVVQL
jgi:hypothetical protein